MQRVDCVLGIEEEALLQGRETLLKETLENLLKNV
jgi:hypothetical protein